MRDQYFRQVDYLRVAVTDRCNLRCSYCMPVQGVELRQHQEILRLEEIYRLVRCAVAVGIKRVRLTGGEPLVRKNLVTLVAQLRELSGLEELSLTTNGTLLSGFARHLRDAGLDRVNISLDTLRQDRFREITRGGDLRRVQEGIAAALAVGLQPVKLNVVVQRGINDDEIIDFARLIFDQPLHVRFIELMPIGAADQSGADAGYISVHEIRQVLARYFELNPGHVQGAGPAEVFQPVGALGTLGFIGALSQCFCEECNRLRLTADGCLRLCLHQGLEIDIKTPLRSGADDSALEALWAEAVRCKPQRHSMQAGWGNQYRGMSQIGG